MMVHAEKHKENKSYDWCRELRRRGGGGVLEVDVDFLFLCGLSGSKDVCGWAKVLVDGLIIVVAAEDKIGGTTLETEQMEWRRSHWSRAI